MEEFFWRNFLGEIFLEDFFGGFFLEEFFWRNFLGEFFLEDFFVSRRQKKKEGNLDP